MKAFLREVSELVELGDGDEPITLTVRDLRAILDKIVWLAELTVKEREERLAMGRVLDGLCDRLVSNDKDTEHALWMLGDLT